MLDEMKKELDRRHCFRITSAADWLNWCTSYTLLSVELQSRLIKTLANHTGIPAPIILNTLNQDWSDNTLLPMTTLHAYEEEASSSIKKLFNRRFFKRHDLGNLDITRSEWLHIIQKFNIQSRQNLNVIFIVETLSRLRRVSFNSLIASVPDEMPLRAAKRTREELFRPNRRFRGFFSEEDHNPLVTDGNQLPQQLREELEKTGVRMTTLSEASPEKGYQQLRRTPGGKKFRPFFGSDVCLFKEITPYGKLEESGRADLSEVCNGDIFSHLPDRDYKRAEPVRFTATYEGMVARSGAKRSHRRAASAADVFRAHGVEVTYEHQKKHHWAHLIAHFLCDASEIISEGDEVINEIPSTSAANYNILEMIELFIREKLIRRETEEITIEVRPEYSGEALIPNLLIYTLTWLTVNDGIEVVNCNTFYVNPQSYARVNQCMLDSIDVLRNRNSLMADDTTDENKGDSVFTLS